ncbi:DUF2225 domain-containing protein [Bacillus sp. T33-2]|uniref:DUF2225 domain-containing protein n=1 Tax=Bacillus sp. T33-2 TaxID=2054168 RepID=UPI000C78C8FB|nr:DUF2225 domain-containing protein [Bacillus sp. T33-2]PLR92630.1 DUF2225 domain-containing protein [Bacillus sp. T33-2]
MAEIELLYDKKYSCIMCGKYFTTKKIRSRFVKVTGYDTDFCPSYSNPAADPNLYYINVCPGCGYSFTDDFSGYFPPGTKDSINDKVCGHWVPQDFNSERSIADAIKTYKLGVYCATLKNEKHIVTAGLYMRLAWLYRSKKDTTQEQRFLKLALKEYVDSYSADDFKGTQVSEVRLYYLIGELHIRTFNMSEAQRYFSKVIEKQKQSLEPKIIQMAKDRWQEVRDQQALGSQL